MKNKRSRLITYIVGFFVFVIPLLFLCKSLDREYKLIRNQEEENLRENLLKDVNKLKNSLDPYNYLNSEFDKIHAQLFLDYPNEIIKGSPDDKSIRNLYSKKVLDKLIESTENFAPIVIILFTQDISEAFYYFSEDLNQELNKDKFVKDFIRAKSYFDLIALEKKYQQAFNVAHKNFLLDEYERFKKINRVNFNYYLKICYNYISRFADYGSGLKPIYTDYFRKQIVYPIIKYTISQKGIHGCYTLLIPQSHISPFDIINQAKNSVDSKIKIEFEDKDKNKANDSGINYYDWGFEYYLDLPTSFISQVYSYKRLREPKELEKDPTELLKKRFKLSVYYSDDIKKFRYFNSLVKILSVSVIFIYLLIVSLVYKIKSSIKLQITRKLICILSFIIIFPIIGIGILTYISARNLDNLIDSNVSRSVHNLLDDYSILNNEIHFRRQSYIHEMKRRINKSTFSKNGLYNNILTAKDIKKWFRIWNSRMFVISMNEDFFCYTQGGEYKSEKKVEEKNIKFKKYILAKYLKNLGLNKKSQKDNKELLTLSFIEDYFNSIIEENIVPQESVPNRGLLTLKSTDTAVYYLAKDKNKNYYFIESILRDYQYEPYYFFNDYSDKVNSLWFKPKIKYADVDLGVAINCHTEDKRLKFPQTKLSNDEIKDFLFDSIYLGDSNKEKTINNEGSIIKESLILDNDPFSVGVIAKTYHNSYLSFNYKMVFPILLAYTIILLILLTNFISVFIKEPVRIYEKAINELNDNNFGITIKSFSKDEFNNITQAFNEMSVAIKQREQIKRYVSDKLVQSVHEKDIQEAGNGKQEKVTILSSDIRNFTGTSELYEPSAIVEMLNGYFTKMQQAISSNGGIIDKYIGDAIQAVFYDEPGEDNMVVRAAKAALGMRKALEEYNKEREESGLFTIQNGIGIDTDYAITGTIGTEKGRKDFSVNGDVIGRAAELEAKTKQTESKILISKRSLKELDCHADKSSRNDGLIYRDFDEESVELIDVR